MDAITIARLLYIRDRKHCDQRLLPPPSFNRGHFGLINQEANDYLFSNDEANKKIDEVFADEIASMQDDYWDGKSQTNTPEHVVLILGQIICSYLARKPARPHLLQNYDQLDVFTTLHVIYL